VSNQYSKEAICRKALIMIGHKGITSFTEGTPRADICSELYEPTVRAALAMYPWDFAKGRENLTISENTPVDEFMYAWVKPSTTLRVLSIRCASVPLENYDVQEDYILTDYSGENTLTMEAIYRIPESKWEDDFTYALMLELSALFCMSVITKPALSDKQHMKADRAWARAKQSNSQQKPHQGFHYPRGSRLVSARR